MRCYSVKNEKITKGIPDVVPYDPRVAVTKAGLIMNAQFILEGNPKDDDTFQDRQSEDLSAASELAYFELVPVNKKRHKYVLIAYNPTEYRLDKEHGDCSEIIYRSPEWFVVRTPLSEGCLIPRIYEPTHFIEVKKGELTRKELTAKAKRDRQRERIRKRREKFTTVYEY